MPYATAEELKAELQPGDAAFDANDDLIEAVVEEASDAIDNYCLRSFVVPSVATVRYYSTTNDGRRIHGLDDIANITDLAIGLDSSGTGTYTALIGSDWYSDVDNLTGVVEDIYLTARTYPHSSGRKNIRVTARFGWPAVPAPVHRACIIWARRLFSRRNSVSGVEGFNDMGVVRISKADPDVQALLDPYVKFSRLLA